MTILAALALGVAALYWFANQRGESPVPANATHDDVAVRAPALTLPALTRSVATGRTTSATDTTARRTAGLVPFIESKYRYLFADLRLGDAVQTELRRLLLLREYVTRADQPARDVDLEQQQATLTAIDQRVRTMLDGGAYALYQELKDSDAAQSHLVLYEVTIANSAPLSPEQERAILEAKLRHKQRYDTIVNDAGLDWENPSATDRAYLRATVTRALDEYKDNYLREARQILNDDGQYSALNTFETIEFKQELNRRQSDINAR